MCELFRCEYCVLLTINMLCHLKVMFIQLLNLLESYYVYVIDTTTNQQFIRFYN